MKKKILALLMCSVLSFAMITGCGSSDDTETATETATEVVEEVAAEVTDGACSDETFADLQDAFAILTEAYNNVNNYYLENDDIPQDDDVEAALASAKEYLDEVGEVNQTDISEADAETIGQSMVDVANGLSQMAEALGIMAEAGAATGDAVSDATFADLQDAFAYLTEEYNAVADYYLNNDAIAQDDDVEAALNSAKEYLDAMGEVTSDSITEADAETLGNSMVEVADALAQLAQAMGLN